MRLLAVLVISLCLCASVAGCDGSSSDQSEQAEPAAVEQEGMPYGSEEYCSMDWTLESIEEHFRSLGFNSFEENPVKPEDDDYDRNIYELYVKNGWFSADPWEAGEQLDPDDTIVIYYNEQPVLTVDSCPDLAQMIERADDYLGFAEEYDGKYVAFDAYVSYQLTTFANDYIIMVSGEDYEENQSHDWTIYIGDRSWDSVVQGATPVGTKVHVEGRIDLDYSEYYDQLYVEGMKLYPVQ